MPNDQSDLYIARNEKLVAATQLKYLKQAINLVKKTIHNGADVNYINNQGKTILYFALESGKVEIAKLLIKRGADVTHKYSGETVLIYAIRFGKIGLAKALLSDPRVSLEHINARNVWGKTALHYAADGFGNVKLVVQALLSDPRVSLEHINARNVWGETALHYAAAGFGNVEVIKALLSDPRVSLEHINAKAKDGKTALHYAAAGFGNVEVIKALLSDPRVSLEHINAKDKDGKTALHYAAAGFRNVEVIKALLSDPRVSLEHINAKSRAGYTAFNIADEQGAYGIAEELIFHGAELGFIDKILYRETIDQYEKFSKAVTTGSAKIVDSMVNPKLANCRVNGKGSALHYAITHNLEDIAVSLIKNGADVKQKSIYGNTPLMLASSKGQQKIVQAIFDRKYRGIDEVNQQGQTALYLAAMASHKQITKLLRLKGADPDLVTKHGDTAGDIMTKKNHSNKEIKGTHTARLVQQGQKGVIPTR